MKTAQPRVTHHCLNRALHIVFFASGFAALVLQLAWQRRLDLVFGCTTEATSLVVAAFILGLGFGSALGGCLTKLPERMLVLVYALAELMIGGIGFLSLYAFGLTEWLYDAYGLPIAAAFGGLCIIIPTTLMGASVPVLVSFLSKRTRRAGAVTSTLYFANTLGASMGALLTSFALFGALGLTGALNIAVDVSIGTALAALLIAVTGKNAA